MSEYNVGDKVYLEGKINEYDESDNTYCVDYCDYYKNTRTTDWVKGDVLHTPDEAYNKGLDDAWELAKKIVLPDHLGGYTVDELKDIFGKNTFASLMNTFSPQEALAKVKAYEERNEIKVGDVVEFKDGCIESIVTKVDGYTIYKLFKSGDCNSCDKKDLKKTDKHYDSIDEFMRSADD